MTSPPMGAILGRCFWVTLWVLLVSTPQCSFFGVPSPPIYHHHMVWDPRYNEGTPELPLGRIWGDLPPYGCHFGALLLGDALGTVGVNPTMLIFWGPLTPHTSSPYGLGPPVQQGDTPEPPWEDLG